MQPNPRLKREREQRGWSQARVAEQIGTDAINVSRWERGFSSPTPFYREKLCLLFGKTAQELGFLLEETPKQPSSQNLLQVSLEERQQHRAEERSSQDPSPPERLLASLSYALWWLTAVPILLFNRNHRFILFHSLQSLLFFGIVTIFDMLIIAVLSLVSLEAIQFVFALVLILLNLVAVTAWIVGMVKAGMGNYYKLPFIGRYSEKMAGVMLERDSVLS